MKTPIGVPHGKVPLPRERKEKEREKSRLEKRQRDFSPLIRWC